MSQIPVHSDRLKPGNRENVVDITNYFLSLRAGLNGPVNGGNGLNAENLTALTNEHLALTFGTFRRGKSIVPTEQSTPDEQNNVWHKMPTPDQVTVTLPTDGLILVVFKALWKNFSTP